MKKKLIYLVIIIGAQFLTAQEKYKPTVIVLKAQEINISKELDSIVKPYINKGLSDAVKERIREENGSFKLKAEKEIEFLEESDFSSNITYGLNFFLSYKLFEHFEDLYIYPSKINTDGSIESLKNISLGEVVNWVVNIKKIELFSLNSNYDLRAIISLQLYNSKNNILLINEEFEVNDLNPGFEFACKNKSIECVINNGIKVMSERILTAMYSDQENWKKY